MHNVCVYKSINRHMLYGLIQAGGDSCYNNLCGSGIIMVRQDFIFDRVLTQSNITIAILKVTSFVLIFYYYSHNPIMTRGRHNSGCFRLLGIQFQVMNMYIDTGSYNM